ncbi:MAG: hypothetical protein ACOCT9_02320 [archaeon]
MKLNNSLSHLKYFYVGFINMLAWMYLIENDLLVWIVFIITSIFFVLIEEMEKKNDKEKKT